jgi:two-component system, chemotaxis family, CheB/CheR fusion protein
MQDWNTSEPRPATANASVIVGLGASAGGLEALRTFLAAVRPDSGAAYVVIQHLDPDHQSMLAQILGRSTTMPVHEAENGATIEPNSVYVIPPNRYLKLVDKGLFLNEAMPRRGLRMPIDYFFRSLAETGQERAIAIVLSGTGSDGTLGIREIKANGGLVLAQDLEEALHDGMPRSALATGLVDISAPAAELPKHVDGYIQHLNNGASTALESAEHTSMRTIIGILKAQTDHDFRSYKKGTLGRRVQRRMGVRHVRSVPEYVDVLRQDKEEAQLLFRDLLINVTRFFRDREAWAELEAMVIAPLVEKAEVGNPIRVWVPGCASGEEAYTIAMLLDEACNRNGRGVDFHIFGTDLDAEAIGTARAGAYPENIVEDLLPERLERYFQKQGDHYQIIKRIRERVVFAPQNLLSDPPFSRLDLVTCRNLLIYLEASVQWQVIQLFHFALADSGCLMLGTSESLGDASELFRVLSANARIYRKIGETSVTRSHFPISDPKDAKRELLKTRRARAVIEEETIANTAQRILLSRHAPAAVVVKQTGEVRYMQGPLKNYVEFPEGEMPFSIYDMAFPDLKGRIRSAIFGAIERKGQFSVVAPRVQRENGAVSVRLDAEMLQANRNGVPVVLLTFTDITPPRPEALAEKDQDVTADPEDYSTVVVERLEQELQSTREDLQSTIAQLETTCEELQSMNEELATVNSELHEKVRELEGVNNDLGNLLTSTNIAVVFLSPDCRIRRFTPAAIDLLNVIPSDIGRPLSDLAPRVDDPYLNADVQQVLKTLVPREREVVSNGQGWFLRRVLPYRTADDRIDGVVLTFSEVTALKDAIRRVGERERQQAVVATLGQKALSRESIEKVLQFTAREIAGALGCEFTKILQLERDGFGLILTAGVGWKDGVVGSAKLGSGLDSQAGFTLHCRAPVIVNDFDKETRFAYPELLLEHQIKAGISVAIGPMDKAWGVIAAHSRTPREFAWEDVNFLQAAANIIYDMVERRRNELDLIERKEHLQLALDAAAMGVWIWDPASDDTIWDDRIYDLLGRKRETFPAKGEAFHSVIHEADRERVRRAAQKVIDEGSEFHEHFRIIRPDGEVRWLAGAGKRLHPDRPSKLAGVNFDITERKLAADRQNVIMRELDHRVKNVLATIVSISSLSSSGATSVDAYTEAFQRRVTALARTHAALADRHWSGCYLRDMLLDELRPYACGGGENFRLDGPDVIVKPSAVQCLTLVFHELTTNAVKHGALSVPDGRIAVTWSLSEKEQMLAIHWREAEGPQVAAPVRQGFGTHMVTEVLTHQLDAKVKTDFDANGFRCTIELPLAQMVLRPDGVTGRRPPDAPDTPRTERSGQAPARR